MNKNKKGFTLIELLVVIAIIGILSGIVLTSLGTAREKARNSSATASLSSTRAEAELYVSTAGIYPATLCTTELDKLLDATTDQAGTAICGINAAGNAWGAMVDLNGSPTTYFCVDSTGYSGASTAAADIAADGTDVKCDNT